MLNVSLIGDTELRAKLSGMPSKIHDALLRKITALSFKLQAYIRIEKLSGQVLKHQSGNLWRSIQQRVDDQGSAIYGRAFSSGDVKYAAIHEFGGKTSPHVIEPVKAKVLAFVMGGKQIFAARVNHPGSVMPERSFMRSSLKDMQQEIVDGMTEAVKEGMQ